MRKEQHSRKAERNGKGGDRMPQEGPKKRKYRKNTVAGSRKGSKWPEEVKTAALADLLVGNNLCAVARRHGVPESTLRSWLAAARKKDPGQTQSLFDDARRDALRALNHNAAAGARVSVEYIRRRLESSQRDAEIYESAVARLDEADGVREEGEAPALPLDPEEQERLKRTMERHRPMGDFAAANYLRALTAVTARAGQMLGEGEDPAEGFTFRIEGEVADYAR